jgi:hypothetical protein
MHAVDAQASNPGLQRARGSRNWLWVLAILASVACSLVSVLSISAVIALDPTRDGHLPTVLILLSLPAWLEAVLFGAPAVAFAGVALLVRRRPAMIAGAVAASLALAAVACLLLIVTASVQWGACSLACNTSDADTAALLRAPRAVKDLMWYAAGVSLVAIPMILVVAVWSLVAGLRRPREP